MLAEGVCGGDWRVVLQVKKPRTWLPPFTSLLCPHGSTTATARRRIADCSPQQAS